MKNFDQSLYDDIKNGTNIISGEEYQQIISAVAKVASDMVVKTLGPYGSTTIMDDGNFTYPSKDGWASINRLRFSDPVYNTIFGVIKQTSFSIVNRVGDGTTSALVGATAFLDAMFKRDWATGDGFRQVDFLNELTAAQDEIIERLLASDEIHTIDKNGDYSDIYRIALISSNGNKKMAEMIQHLYQETANPNIYVTLNPASEMTYEIQTGYKFDCNALMHKAYVNSDDNTCHKSNTRTMVAIFDANVTYNEHAEMISMLSRMAGQRDIIIIAPYIDDITTTIVGTTINSFLQKNQVPNIMMLQVPLSMDIQRAYLSDIVLLTNAQVIDYGKVRAFNVMLHNIKNPDEKIEDALLNIDQYKFDSPEDLLTACIGYIDTITVGSNYAIIENFGNIVNPTLYKQTIDEVSKTYAAAKVKANKSSHLAKEYMEAHQRYVRLIGSLGVIKVGGNSELEKHCLKDAVDDAVLACRSAFENGYVRGMNLSMLQIIDDIVNDVEQNDQISGDVYAILKETFIAITKAVLCNKYSDNIRRLVSRTSPDADGAALIECNNDGIIEYCLRNKCGYNLVTESFDYYDELTVINSVSTDIEILKAVVGILSLMLTSNQLLSVNRMCDRKLNHRQVMEQRMEDQKLMAGAVADALIERLSENTKIIGDALYKLRR